ncbi:MAG TPA: hypothetical protein VMY76_06475 [Gemmatimonadales bacterium]|nr:hypothetical protein [Gemmatimonadales bacterium]
MDQQAQPLARLVLLIDSDAAARDPVRALLVPKELELIHARGSVAGLEILQRLPERFRLVMVNVEMPVLSGAVVILTLRLCLPDLPVLCMRPQRLAAASVGGDCLPSPFELPELRAHLDEALAGIHDVPGIDTVSPKTLARAKAVFNATGNLLDAARELERDTPGEAASGW